MYEKNLGGTKDPFMKLIMVVTLSIYISVEEN